MGIKSAFKKLWKGVKVAAPYLGMAAMFVPGGSPLGLALLTIESLIEKAEDIFSGQGSGLQKGALVSRESLIALELLTGKNVDNPKTRGIVDAIIANVVETKNVVARSQELAESYKELVKDLKDAIDSVKEPAKADTVIEAEGGGL